MKIWQVSFARFRALMGKEWGLKTRMGIFGLMSLRILNFQISPQTCRLREVFPIT